MAQIRRSAGPRTGWRMFSPSAQQGLRAMLRLAAHYGEGPTPASRIAAEAMIPRAFLAKLLLILRNADLVDTVRGPGGGYRLRRAPSRIQVGRIIEIFDGPLRNSSCVLGLAACDDAHPCALHSYWKAMREQYMEKIASLSLEQAIEELGRAESRGPA